MVSANFRNTGSFSKPSIFLPASLCQKDKAIMAFKNVKTKSVEY